MKKALLPLFFMTLFSTHLMAMDTPSLKCNGTEPFWSATAKGTALSLSSPGEKVKTYKIKSTKPAQGTSDGWTTLITAENLKGKIALITRKEECNDGMSDEVYAYSAYVQVGSELLVGCCKDN